MTRKQQIREQAIAWAVRSGDPAFDAWEEFTLWLEADPAHAGAYDRVTADVAEAADLLPPAPLAANDDAAPAAPANPAIRARRNRWLDAGIAAGLAAVAVIGVVSWRGGAHDYRTEPGQTQLVELDGGGTILLAGDSHLSIQRANPRLATLERGRALFTLQSDGDAPFTLTVGAERLTDIGTVFDVTRNGQGLSVAVSEGAVLFDPDGDRVTVRPGQMLTHDTARDRYRLMAIDPAQVGEWREGRLTFTDAPLADVAAELTRATGVAFTVADGGAGAAISGSILVDPVRADPRTIGPLLGVSVRPGGAGWIIGAA